MTAEHIYITVGARRWCLGCNTYQVWRGGRWRDGFPPEPWPGYEATQARCPRLNLEESCSRAMT